MSNDFFDKAAVGDALADLAEAYRLVSDVAKSSKEGSKCKKDTTIALTLMESGFKMLSHYASPITTAAQNKIIEKAKIIPTIDN